MLLRRGCEVPYSGHDLEQAYRRLSGELSQELAEVDRSLQQFDQIAAEANEALTKATQTLAAVYLPELSAPALAEAERKTGFRGFTRFNPMQAMVKEDALLTGEIARIVADQDYVRREYLVGKNGSITLRLAEATDNLANWQSDCDRFEKLDGFLDLVEAKYDTPEFEHRWWTTNYWWQWKTGDRICGELNLADFGDDVLPAYRKCQVPRDQWKGEVQRISGERDAVIALVQKHDTSVLRKQNLVAAYLEDCRRALAAHLRVADPQLLLQWSDQDRGLVVLLQEISGLKAKEEYAREMKGQVSTEAGILRAKADHAGLKATKLARPKKQGMVFPDTDYPQKAFDSMPKLRARREKTMGVADRIRRYNDYDSFALTNDPSLWWFVMTGRPPGYYNPGLQGWYDRNPNPSVVWIEDARDEHLHATALGDADSGHDSLGDLS